MKVDETSLLTLLSPTVCFRIPVYQRNYSWTKQQCQQLYEDIRYTGQRRSENPEAPSAQHFVGPIVYVEHNDDSRAKHERLVIDGQQRITTSILLLNALSYAVGSSEPLEGFSRDDIRDNWIINPRSKDSRYYKLHLTATDNDTMRKIVGRPETVGIDPERSTGDSEALWAAYEWFQSALERDSQQPDSLSNICLGLEGLRIIHVKLTPKQDNPQAIFESMNSTGLDLAKSDLVRNFLLMGCEPDEQVRLYDDYWSKMERIFAGKKYRTRFDGFLRHYVALVEGALPTRRNVYRTFKRHCTNNSLSSASVLEQLHRYSTYYAQIVHSTDDTSHPKLRAALRNLNELGVEVSHPVLLRLYHAYRSGTLTADAFVHAVSLIESYFFRRAVCDLPTNAYNNMFASLARDLESEVSLNHIIDYFSKGIKNEKYRFPGDHEFKSHLLRRNMYDFRPCPYWLWRLENLDRKDPVPRSQYSVEHVMPQTLTEDWRSHLGATHETIHSTLRHSLGNLTLLAQNSDIGNLPFEKKQKLAFNTSPLKLNELLRSSHGSAWTDKSIVARGTALADIALRAWIDLTRVPDS